MLDSLSFAGAVPSDLLSAYARGGFQECHLEAPPLSVNVRIGGTEADPVLWHGTPLDDLSDLSGGEANREAENE